MEEVVDNSTPCKGKPSSFFLMTKKEGPTTDPANTNNYELNDEQWAFIFLHYSEYAAYPYELMLWLFEDAAKLVNFQA
jgi:hypothetical protein